MKRVDLGDVELAVHDQGQGPPLLLVHGFPLDHSMWQPLLDPLSRRQRVLAPDLRGFGRSAVTEGLVAMETFADDLARLLDALEVHEPVTLAGLSMGGYIAWQFWRRHQERLAALVLCDTRAAADTVEIARGRLQTAERVLVQGPAVLADAMLERLFAPASRAEAPALIQSTRDVILGTSPHGIAAALRGMAQRPDVTDWLREIDLPALVVCGEHDVISPPAEMRAWAAVLPQSRYVEIPAAGHMAPLEQPQAFLRAWDDWHVSR